jgi:4-amino-4-deoxy-L-arabinose transferase-like glycosyltransferase
MRWVALLVSIACAIVMAMSTHSFSLHAVGFRDPPQRLLLLAVLAVLGVVVLWFAFCRQRRSEIARG